MAVAHHEITYNIQGVMNTGISRITIDNSITMQFSFSNLEIDEDDNPIFKPAVVFATSDINLVNNSEQLLMRTFRYKVEKILPGIKFNNLQEHNTDRKAINYLINNAKNAFWFSQQESQEARQAMLMFKYRNIWATFNDHSTEEHVRLALSAWKKVIMDHAKDQDIKLMPLTFSTIFSMEDVVKKVLSLPKGVDYVLVFAEPNAKLIYKEFSIDMHEWLSLLFSKQGTVRTFDTTTTKQDLLHQNKNDNDCITCDVSEKTEGGKQTTTPSCKHCRQNYQCTTCRNKVYYDLHQNGVNPHCIVCHHYTPIFNNSNHVYYLVEEEDEEKKITMNKVLPYLEKLYGTIQIVNK